jgi:hypothetical protein
LHAHLIAVNQVAKAKVDEQERQYERRHDRKREAKQVEQEDFWDFGMVRKRVNVSRLVQVTKYASPEEVVH